MPQGAIRLENPLFLGRSNTVFAVTALGYEHHIQSGLHPVISQSLVELGYHENQALVWRLNALAFSDTEKRPVFSHFTQRNVLCSSTCVLNRMVERETQTSFDPLQLLQFCQTLQRDVGKAKCRVQC